MNSIRILTILSVSLVFIKLAPAIAALEGPTEFKEAVFGLQNGSDQCPTKITARLNDDKLALDTELLEAFETFKLKCNKSNNKSIHEQHNLQRADNGNVSQATWQTEKSCSEIFEKTLFKLNLKPPNQQHLLLFEFTRGKSNKKPLVRCEYVIPSS